MMSKRIVSLLIIGCILTGLFLLFGISWGALQWYYGKSVSVGSVLDSLNRRVSCLVTTSANDFYSMLPRKISMSQIGYVDKVVLLRVTEPDISLVRVEGSSLDELLEVGEDGSRELNFTLVFGPEEWDQFKDFVNQIDREFQKL